MVDPRRTETAEHAAEHVAVRPGGDPYLLLGMLHVLFAEGLVRPRPPRRPLRRARRAARRSPRDWPPERAAPHRRRRRGRRSRGSRASSPPRRAAVAYGRVGVCQQQTGSLTHWLINALNVVTGNLDRAGGAMFPTPAVDARRGCCSGRPADSALRALHASASAGCPSSRGELPVAGLAEEILTPGEGQVRGHARSIAGNPVLSTPGRRAARRGAGSSSSGASRSTCTSPRRRATRT